MSTNKQQPATAKQDLLAKIKAQRSASQTPTPEPQAATPNPRVSILNRIKSNTIAQPTQAAQEDTQSELKLSELSESEELKSLLEIQDPLKELENFNPEQFVSKLPQFAQAIESKAPSVATYLQDIHKNLVQYPELVHILNDEQLSLICQGLLYVTNTEMAKISSNPRTKGKLTVEQGEALFK